ncbi:MAG TPA: hypothetical protein VM124_03285 [Candidatus Limnocylindrales bacterium]|nr:hypothetical protein [Candidatus Limnocylindrales bacterium]
MNIANVNVTPDLLATARHTIWHDTPETLGDGLKTAMAPHVFGIWDRPGDEYVRFGKILGLAGGKEATMPVLPELLNSAMEASENDAAQATHVDEIKPGTNVPELWHGFFVRQIVAIGALAVECLQMGTVKPINDPNRHARGLLYVASVVDPQAGVATIEPTPYDRFDPFAYTNVADKSDLRFRLWLAGELKMAGLSIKGGRAMDVNADDLSEAVEEFMGDRVAA